MKRSIRGSSDRVSPRLAPCSQTRRPRGRGRCDVAHAFSQSLGIFLASSCAPVEQSAGEGSRRDRREPVQFQKRHVSCLLRLPVRIGRLTASSPREFGPSPEPMILSPGKTANFGSDYSSSTSGSSRPIKVHHEITHVRVVDCRLGFRFPRRERAGVVRIDADDVELARIAEGDAVKRLQLAAKYKMQQLLSFFAEVAWVVLFIFPSSACRASARL